jgi:PBP1b-binding outer membrane lipoprotein LpoB
MRTTVTTALLIFASLMLASCSQQEDPQPPPVKKQGRAETQGIRNTDAIGYSGSAIANKVDGALNASDQQKQKMDQALQNAEKPQPDPQ